MIEVKVDKKPEGEGGYPCLKVAPSTKHLVLFTSPNTGIQLSDIKWHQRRFGEYSENWSEVDFIPFHGSITLTQE